MKTVHPHPRRMLRLSALLLTGLLNVPLLAACSSPERGGGPPIDDARGGRPSYSTSQRQPQQANRGMSNQQKVAILAGAAALYYLYNQHKNSQGQGAQGQYYLSKNGRVYYRDAQNRPHWVTPPPEGIRVPESEAQQYRDFKGYNNNPTGRDLTGLGADPVPSTP